MQLLATRGERGSITLSLCGEPIQHRGVQANAVFLARLDELCLRRDLRSLRGMREFVGDEVHCLILERSSLFQHIMDNFGVHSGPVCVLNTVRPESRHTAHMLEAVAPSIILGATAQRHTWLWLSEAQTSPREARPPAQTRSGPASTLGRAPASTASPST